MNHHPRTPQAGLTLLEILIALAIVALVATIGAVMYVKHLDRARLSTAHTRTRQLAGAWARWSMTASAPCPTLDDLKAELGIDKGQSLKDPWGQAFEIVCPDFPDACDSGRCVRSLGPDGKPGTGDDLASWQDAPG